MSYKISDNKLRRAGVYAICMAMLLGTLAGCGDAAESVSDTIAAVTGGEENKDSKSGGNDSKVITASTSSELSDIKINLLEADGMFTDRDKDADYDEASATKITLSDTVTITEEGTYILSGTLSDGQVIVDAADTAKVQLVLDGVSITSKNSAAIYVKNADKVFITLAEGSENTLKTTGEFEADGDNNIDGVIYAKDTVTFNGAGTLNIDSASGHGIVGKDTLKFTGGTYNISAEKTAISGKDSVRIADGTFNLNAGTDGIHSENADDEDKGYIYIEGGTFDVEAGSDAFDASLTLQIEDGFITIDADDDAFHADGDLIINGGNINIKSCYEGLEGTTVTVNGGDIYVDASDDGINAAGGNDGSGFGGKGGDMFKSEDGVAVFINGGNLTVISEGDGLDSNGNLYMSGGNVRVYGPTNDGNGSLDYNGDAIITGGTLLAAGSGGMAQNFGSNSTQGSILLNMQSRMSAGTEITVTDSKGNVIISETAEKDYSCIIVSSPDIKDGESYTVSAGNYSETVTMDGLIYGGGSGMGFGGGRGGFGEGGFDRGSFEGGQNGQNVQNGQMPQGQRPDFQNGEAPNFGNGGGSMTPPDMQNGGQQQRGQRGQRGQN